MEQLRIAIHDPSISRIIIEGHHKSGRTTTISEALSQIDPDLILSVGCENIGILKSMVGFSSVATYSSKGSFRVVVVDDAEALLENRGTSRQLLEFMASLSRTKSIKVIVVILPIRKHKRASLVHKKLISPEFSDHIVIIDSFEGGEGDVHDVIDKVITCGKTSAEDIHFLVAMRTEAYEVLERRIREKKKAKSQALIDLMEMELSLARDSFDDTSSNMMATLRILAMIRYLS